MILFIVRSVWNTNTVWAECNFFMLKQTVHIVTTVQYFIMVVAWSAIHSLFLWPCPYLRVAGAPSAIGSSTSRTSAPRSAMVRTEPTVACQLARTYIRTTPLLAFPTSSTKHGQVSGVEKPHRKKHSFCCRLRVRRTRTSSWKTYGRKVLCAFKTSGMASLLAVSL